MKRLPVMLAAFAILLLAMEANVQAKGPNVETRECTLIHLNYYAGTYTDPIVWPGFNGFDQSDGPHRHYFFGQPATAQFPGPDITLPVPDVNTCLPVTNRNVYWAPALQQVASPNFPIGAVGATVVIRSGPRQPIPPTGLQVVSREAVFTCPGQTPSRTPVGCSDGFAHMQVSYQDCWNGTALRGVGYGHAYTQPHVAFRLGTVCPTGFSKIARLTVTFHYDLRPSLSQTDALEVRMGPGNLVNGDPFGGHADVIWAAS